MVLSSKEKQEGYLHEGPRFGGGYGFTPGHGTAFPTCMNLPNAAMISMAPDIPNTGNSLFVVANGYEWYRKA
jgi:hypothetical protein